MKTAKTYGEFLNLTVDEANDLVHYAMRKNKVTFATELAKWIARVQTEHVLNGIKYELDECETLYKFARGDNYTNSVFDEME